MSRNDLGTILVEQDEGIHGTGRASFPQSFPVGWGRPAGEVRDALVVELEEVGSDVDAVTEPHAQVPVDLDGQCPEAALSEVWQNVPPPVWFRVEPGTWESGSDRARAARRVRQAAAKAYPRPL